MMNNAVGQAEINPVGQASRQRSSRTGVPPVLNSAGQASRLSKNKSPLSDNFWKRRLPHFQLSAGYYFITFTAFQRQLLSSPQKDCIFNAIRFMDGKKYELFAVVVLDNHVHMIINPADALSKIMHSIKSFTAHEINKMSNRKGMVWQDENYDRAIRSENELSEKIVYIANNPAKAGLVTNIEEKEGYSPYKWLFIKGWLNDEMLTGETPVPLNNNTDRRDACPTLNNERDACPTLNNGRDAACPTAQKHDESR